MWGYRGESKDKDLCDSVTLRRTETVIRMTWRHGDKDFFEGQKRKIEPAAKTRQNRGEKTTFKKGNDNWLKRTHKNSFGKVEDSYKMNKKVGFIYSGRDVFCAM